MSTAPTVDPATFRLLMGRWPSGVAIVTAREGARDYGLTVNALLSVSLSPPLLLVSLGSAADTTPVVERSHAFAASFLAAGQRRLSDRFAREIPPEEKFRGVATSRGPLGLALLDGAVGSVECRVQSITPIADHRVIVGEVGSVAFGEDATPLVFHRGGYAGATGPRSLTLPPPRVG